MKVSHLRLALCVCLTAPVGAAIAQKNEAEGIQEVIVTAHPLSGEGLSQAGIVLGGAELERKLATSLGATLSTEPGINSAQYGAAVSRPVIHGLGGPRVRIMEDRIDTLDVSVTSSDHAVTVEPFVADRIEVLKGPSALLYGSGAIGGVVDVHTGRIPHVLPDAALSGGIESRYDNNSEGLNTTIKADGRLGERWAWHVDANWKDAEDYEIPGFAESSRLRALEAAEEEHDDHDEHDEHEGEAHDEGEVRGELPGSALDFETYAGGVSYVADWGFLGVAVSQTQANYGLPGGHGHHHEEDHGEGDHEEEHEGEHEGEEEEGNPVLDLEQTRIDLELGVKDPFGAFDSLNIRLGINDYEHVEIEPNGEVATEFTNEAWELRGELTYSTELWKGAFGVQHTDRDFSATGAEAFVPPVETVETGLFWIAERPFERFDLEVGARIGRLEHDPSNASKDSFTTYAVSVGAVVPLGDNWKLGLVADQASRAPVSEELYSNGPHLATNAFEIGDSTLDTETATGLAATLSFDRGDWEGAATVYYNHFSKFIYQQATGEEEDELPVFQFRQNDADFVGIDLEASVRLAQWESGNVTLRGMLDYVSAERGDERLPRIPPLRYGAGVSVRFGQIDANLDYMRVSAQDKVADYELKTDAYNDLRLFVGIERSTSSGSMGLFVQGKNLTDDEQRQHTSFIKDFAPSPGRTLEVGVRVTF